MKRKLVALTALCSFALLAALFLSCGKGDKGQIPVTTKSKEALKLYREGMAQMEQYQNEKAKALFKQAIEKDTTFAMAYYRLSSVSSEAPDFLKYFKKALSLADQASEGEKRFIQAINEFNFGNTDKGLELSLKLTELFPGDREVHANYAGLLNTLQKYDEAAVEYQKAVEIDPAWAAGFNYMAMGYMRAGKMDEAEKAVKKYIELRPGEANAYDTQGFIQTKTGKIAESLASYRKALSLDSTFNSSYRGIGINLALQGKTADAVAEFEIAAEKARNSGEKRNAFYNMGFAWILAGNFQKAEETVQRSLAVSEKDKDLISQNSDFSSIAIIKLEQNQFREYEKYKTEAHKRLEASEASEDIKKLFRIGWVFMESDVARKQGQLRKARDKAEEFRRVAVPEKDAYYALMVQDLIGSLALAEKRYDDAIRELEKSYTSNCYILFRLGEAYAAKGDKAKAKELFSKVVNFNESDWGFAFLRAKAQKKLAGL
jgi:tetratricopeptide (TPR) repeat protein